MLYEDTSTNIHLCRQKSRLNSFNSALHQCTYAVAGMESGMELDSIWTTPFAAEGITCTCMQSCQQLTRCAYNCFSRSLL